MIVASLAIMFVAQQPASGLPSSPPMRVEHDQKELSNVVDIQFDESGNPVSCKILKSSGSEAEDKATCANLMSGRAIIGGMPVREKVPPPKSELKIDDVVERTDPALPRLTNLQDVYGTDDYPIEALREEKQGTVGMMVTIDPAGQPTRCEVTTSSKVPSLDSASCQLMMARGRFTAERGAKPRLVPQRVRWMLPEGDWAAEFADGYLRMRFDVDGQGKIIRCSEEKNVEMFGGQSSCELFAPTMQQGMSGLIASHSVASRSIIYEHGLLVGGPDVSRGVGHASGQELVGKASVAMTIDADGRVENCGRVDEGEWEIRSPNDMCGMARTTVFEPLAPDASDRSARHAVYYQALYLAPQRK